MLTHRAGKGIKNFKKATKDEDKEKIEEKKEDV